MNVSDYILEFLEKKKIKDVFLITGGAVSFLVDAFSRNKKIKYTSVAHVLFISKIFALEK